METKMLLTQSKVRELIKEDANGMRCSEDFLEALNAEVYMTVLNALRRAKKNSRVTLRSFDL